MLCNYSNWPGIVMASQVSQHKWVLEGVRQASCHRYMSTSKLACTNHQPIPQLKMQLPQLWLSLSQLREETGRMTMKP